MTALHDPDRGRLEIVRPIAQGRSFDVYVVRRSDDGTVATARAPRLRSSDDEGERRQREAAMEIETAAGALGIAGLAPPAVVWHVGPGRDTVLVHEHVEGTRLDAWLATRAPDGLPTHEIVAIARQLANTLADLHEAGFVHRSISPDHVLVTPDARTVLIGLGNLGRRGEPACAAKETTDDAYSAPEVQGEVSGRFDVPRADIYAFGMLLSFLATGQRPTGDVSAPLTRTAARRLEQVDEGIALLVAKCAQPLQKNRLAPMRRIVSFLDLDALPSPSTEGFGPMALLAPWGAADGAGLRVGHLSPGPLVDRPPSSGGMEEDDRSAEDSGADGTGAVDPAVSSPRPATGSVLLRWTVSALVVLAALYVTVRHLLG